VRQHTNSATVDGGADLIALNQVRLEEDLTYGELGEQIGINGAALHRILNGQSDPIDRTLFKIRRFLDEHEAAKGAAPRKRKGRAV
jgi:transcriptional regulator with XRE-family HTH domain